MCTVCHSTWPAGAGPHGVVAPTIRDFVFEPDHSSAPEPGASVMYTHTLKNTGNVSDTYSLAWSSSTGWAAVTAPSSVALDSGQSRVMTVTVNVPMSGSRGITDITVLTATSAFSATHILKVTDITIIPVTRLYLPIVLR